jgi:hypothetical protein
VALRIMILCSLVRGTNVSEKYIASIFRVEMSNFGKMAGYTEIGGKDTSHG